MSENIMKTIYVIRVYAEEWDEWGRYLRRR